MSARGKAAEHFVKVGFSAAGLRMVPILPVENQNVEMISHWRDDCSTTYCAVVADYEAAPAKASARTDFAVIIPAYNERDNVAALFDALATVFAREDLGGEIVFVDDGSTDGTFEAAQLASAVFGGRARVIRHGRNVGKTEAIVTAARNTERRYVVLLDADLQYAPEDIPRFLDSLDAGWDVVTARKVGDYQKQFVSNVYNRLSARLFDVPVSDLNSMKACRRDLFDEIPLRHDWHRFFVVLAHMRGSRVTEIDVALHPRHAGESKYNSRRRILTGVGDLLVVWFALRVRAKPMHFFGGLGLWALGSGAVLGLITAALRAADVPPPPIGYRPILGLIAVLLLSGVILFAMGIVAELVAILHSEVEALRAEVRQRRRVP
jgi:glycosyltransferase involved in cell wall biosynthesis